ncbi:MFS transporter, partial [Streptomyces sp. TRM68367]|nr:MFS transporter [Streptomyces sp. TRM68367]
ITVMSCASTPTTRHTRTVDLHESRWNFLTPLGGLATGSLVDSVGLSSTLLAVGGVYLLATLCPVIFPAWRQMDRIGSPRARAEGSLPQGSGAKRV